MTLVQFCCVLTGAFVGTAVALWIMLLVGKRRMRDEVRFHLLYTLAVDPADQAADDRRDHPFD